MTVVLNIDCRGNPHRIILATNGQLKLLDHSAEESRLERGRWLAGLPPEHACASVLRGLRTLGREGAVPGPLVKHILDADALNRDRRRSREWTDLLELPIEQRIREVIRQRGSRVAGTFGDAYRRWSGEDIRLFYNRHSERIEYHAARGPLFGEVPWDRRSWHVVRHGFAILVPDDCDESPALVFWAHLHPDGWDARALRALTKDALPEIWRCVISRDDAGEYRAPLAGGARYRVRWINRRDVP